jgi:hypothetical protein
MGICFTEHTLRPGDGERSNDPILVFGTLQEMFLIRPATSKRAKELALSQNQSD